MSHLKVEMGQLTEAADAARRVLECNQKIGSWWASIAAYAILGLHALERGQLPEARRCRAEILSLFEERNFWVGDFSYAERFLARLAEVEGERGRALARLDHAIAAYDGRDVLCWSRLQLERARLLLALDRAEACRAARRVRSRAVAAGARPLVAQADAILARVAVGD
jgi:tetratricopeptide (TPR) repeat protein